MLRRKRRRLLKLAMTICAAIFFVGVMLKAAVTSFELQSFTNAATDHEKLSPEMSKLSGIATFYFFKVSVYRSIF